jgi:hypothetical protein
MPEKVTLDEDLGVVRIESYGQVTADDMRASLALALSIHQERGLTRGFVDATKVTSYPSTFPIYEFGSEAAEPLKGFRLAIAAPPELLDDPAFFETVVNNRGGTVRVFDARDAALAWLMEGSNNDQKSR